MELGELHDHAAEFKAKGVTLMAVSMDDVPDAMAAQTKLPEFTIVSDHSKAIAQALAIVHPNAGRDGDANAPTVLLVDEKGIVKMLYRSTHLATRMGSSNLLEAVDRSF